MLHSALAMLIVCALEIGPSGKHYEIKRLEERCIDRLSRHRKSETQRLAPTWEERSFTRTYPVSGVDLPRNTRLLVDLPQGPTSPETPMSQAA